MSFSKNLPNAIKILHPNIFPVSGKGSWISCLTGKTYLDLTSGIGALFTGKFHIIKKVKEQVEQYVHMPQQLFNIHTASNKLTKKFSQYASKFLDNIFYGIWF